MSHEHTKAAFQCNLFTGNTRLLLIYLADAAYSQESIERCKTKRKRFLPYGYCRRSIQQMMRALNTKRRQTVTDCLIELRDKGAIKTITIPMKTSKTFVDIEFLREHESQVIKSDNGKCCDYPDETTESVVPDNANRDTETTESVSLYLKGLHVPVTGKEEIQDASRKSLSSFLPKQKPETKSAKSPAQSPSLSSLVSNPNGLKSPKVCACGHVYRPDHNHYPFCPINDPHLEDCPCLRCKGDYDGYVKIESMKRKYEARTNATEMRVSL